jgi:hypothetical protein
MSADDMQAARQNGHASKMEGSFQAESYSMTMEQKASGTPMGEMTMKGKIDGKRLGDCPA